MWKKLLVLAVLLGFGWSYPPTRGVLSNAAAPVLEKLGPVGQRAVEPTRRYDAKNEVEFIADQIEMERTEGRAVPNPRTFQPWLKQHVTTRRDGVDPWGKPYYLVRSGQTHVVGSEGKDGERGTPDDIRAPLPF
jgi:hypothetical protein